MPRPWGVVTTAQLGNNQPTTFDLTDLVKEWINGTNGEEIFYVDQKPMFLMKYFATVAANEVGKAEFYTLDVAEYLEEAKRLILEQATGTDYELIIPEYLASNVNTIRLEHPHLPQTYCLLAMELAYTVFN